MLKISQVAVSFQVGLLHGVLPFMPVGDHPANDLPHDSFGPFDDQFNGQVRKMLLKKSYSRARLQGYTIIYIRRKRFYEYPIHSYEKYFTCPCCLHHFIILQLNTLDVFERAGAGAGHHFPRC